MTIDREKLIADTAYAAYCLDHPDGGGYDCYMRKYWEARMGKAITVIEPFLAAGDKMYGALLTYKCSYDPHHGQIVREAVEKALAAYEQATGKEPS